ncbi:MAG: lipid A deacylase LpxR family protein [Rhodospirillales bacterium]|nr:lipid A deacylase LpxR family protein [Rhodospirillales bacterium]
MACIVLIGGSMGAVQAAENADPAKTAEPAGTAEPAEIAEPAEKELGTLSLKFENDLFSGADQHYTNGVRLSWLSPEGDTFRPLQTIRDLLEEIAQDENKTTRFGLSAGQDMYTPKDSKARELLVDDRPYAGWLYGGLSLHTVSDHGQGRMDQESVEVNVGIIGPWSLAEVNQDFVHSVRSIEKFNGWDNQLHNEPGLLINYERKWRLFDPIKWGGTGFDAIPHAGASLGNVMTGANAGGAVRWGWNLPKDFGPPGLIHSVSPLDRRPDESISFYAFASLQGRFVAHNIFLDGNTFRDSHSVDKNNWVGDASLGVALLVGRFEIAYTNAFRSREFAGQDDHSRFGSLAVSFQAVF